MIFYTNHILRFFSAFCILLLFSEGTIAQNLENLGNGKLLKVNGSFSTNHVFYGVNGIESRRDPYNYFFSGNVNLGLYGWDVPLSFTYSNQRSSFRQPFNQYGMRPTYKWATGYLGYNSMNFSPYTLAGHIFLGAGVDLTPGKFNVSAMYGRLQKAVGPDTLNSYNIVPAYKRMGYGLKAGYQDGKDQFTFIIFGARDEQGSISMPPDSLGILPEENLVLSVSGAKALGKNIVLNAEYANSAITSDTRAEQIDPENHQVYTYTGSLFTPRTSSSYYSAYKAGLNYQLDFMSLGLGYEHVDPGYRTLGAYYFNNDLESYTVNAAYNFVKAKVNVAANCGLQKNNLDNTQLNETKRLVGSLNVNWQAGERLNLSSSYSNFTTFTDIRTQFERINELTPYDNLDTLNYEQISQSANLNANYLLKKGKDERQNINFNFSYQNSTDRQGGVDTGSGSDYYNYNIAYNISFIPSGMNVTLAFNGNNVIMDEVNSSTYGPTLSFTKAMLEKKLRNTFSTSYIASYADGDRVNRIANFRFNSNYNLKQKHNINLSAVVLNRNSNAQMNNAFTEYTVSMAYNYNF